MAQWEKEHLTALVQASQEAIRRFRFVFILISVTGILILSAQMNGRFAWLQSTRKRTANTDDVDLIETRKVIKESLYRDLYVTSVPLIGLKISIYDIEVIGSIALWILAIWFFVASRRENHAVRAIVKTAKSVTDKDCLGYLFHGLQLHFVLQPLTPFSEDDTEEKKEKVFFGAIVNLAIRLTSYMPFWVPLVAICFDLESLFSTDAAIHSATKTLWSGLPDKDRVECFVRMAICGLLALVSLFWLWRSWIWADRTHHYLETLQQYMNGATRDTERGAEAASSTVERADKSVVPAVDSDETKAIQPEALAPPSGTNT